MKAFCQYENSEMVKIIQQLPFCYEISSLLFMSWPTHFSIPLSEVTVYMHTLVYLNVWIGLNVYKPTLYPRSVSLENPGENVKCTDARMLTLPRMSRLHCQTCVQNSPPNHRQIPKARPSKSSVPCLTFLWDSLYLWARFLTESQVTTSHSPPGCFLSPAVA